jgi:hypothetical protein
MFLLTQIQTIQPTWIEHLDLVQLAMIAMIGSLTWSAKRYLDRQVKKFDEHDAKLDKHETDINRLNYDLGTLKTAHDLIHSNDISLLEKIKHVTTTAEHYKHNEY